MSMDSVSPSFRMERIERIDGSVSYEVTDDRGRSIILSPQRAYEMLDWLYELRAELHQAATGNSESITVNPIDGVLVDGQWREKGYTPATEENDQAVRCAVDQVPQDMPYVEVIDASLYKKTETFGARPGLSVQGVRWYVEVEVRNRNDETTATVLYRVWRAEIGDFKATRITIV